jgi:putative transposase
MTWPRRVVPGTTYLLTRRCTERRYLLVPRGVSPKLVGYCIALAAARHGVVLHAVMVMSNHWHAVLTDPDGCVTEFARDVHALIARSLNAHYGRWESFWSSQRLSLVEVSGADDVLDKLVYTTTNPVETGLVERPRDWPGLRTLPAHVLDAPRRFARPKTRFFRRSGLPEEVELKLTVPPQLAQLGSREYVRRYEARVRERVEAAGGRRVSEGRRVLGVHALKRQRKDGRPKTPAARRKLDPAIASRDPARRVSLLTELRAFRDAYREARRRWFEGDTGVLFPRGTLLMASLPTVQCERGPPCVLQAA